MRIAPFSAFEFFFYEAYKQTLFSGDATSKTSKLLCGGLTGMTASTLTYPLDLIRTKLSIAVDNPGASERPSMAGVGRQIYRTEGFFGLYKGLFSTLFVSKILACLTYCYRASYHTLDLRWHHLTYSRPFSWLTKTIHTSS